MQAAGQDRRLDHRGLGAVEAVERRMARLVHDAAMEARPLLVLLHMLDRELGMAQRAVEHGAGHMRRRPRRPVLAAGEAAGEDAHVVGVVGDGEGVARRLSSVVDGRNGAMTKPPSSTISPSGAICTLPSSLSVVTIVSRIMGMAAYS